MIHLQNSKEDHKENPGQIVLMKAVVRTSHWNMNWAKSGPNWKVREL